MHASTPIQQVKNICEVSSLHCTSPFNLVSLGGGYSIQLISLIIAGHTDSSHDFLSASFWHFQTLQISAHQISNIQPVNHVIMQGSLFQLQDHGQLINQLNTAGYKQPVKNRSFAQTSKQYSLQQCSNRLMMALE